MILERVRRLGRRPERPREVRMVVLLARPDRLWTFLARLVAPLDVREEIAATGSEDGVHKDPPAIARFFAPSPHVEF